MSRRLDAEVAERVMGWDIRKSKHGHWIVEDDQGVIHEDGFGRDQFNPSNGKPERRKWWDEVHCPCYSTNIEAAWLVVEKMKESTSLFQLIIEEKSGYLAIFDKVYHGGSDTSAAEAICCAALMSKEKE